jgi:hypothetical protein
MLYNSTKVLLRGMQLSLEGTASIRWDDQAELASECSFEMHQMARPLYQGYRVDRLNQLPVLIPVFERAARAIPHIKCMARAIRRKDQAGAVESVKAALAEM